MRRWTIAFVTLLGLSACSGGNVTLNFTFMGTADCNAQGIDSVSYVVTDANGKVDASGTVTCGDAANFSLGAGSYVVTAYAASDGYCLGSTGAPLDVTGSGANITVDFTQLSPGAVGCPNDM